MSAHGATTLPPRTEITATLDRAPSAQPADITWKWLYTTGAVAALFGVTLIPAQLVVFAVWGQPDTAAGWFSLFQSNALGGLLAFEFLFVINAVVGIATTLALYVALRRTNESLMALALGLGLLESVFMVMARPGIEMMHLSSQYAAASTDAQRALLLAVGEALRATFSGTAFHLSYNLFSVVLLIVPFVMLRGNVFSKLTAYVGVTAAILNWGLYVPEVGVALSAISVLPLAIWNILVARRLWQLAKETSAMVS